MGQHHSQLSLGKNGFEIKVPIGDTFFGDLSQVTVSPRELRFSSCPKRLQKSSRAEITFSKIFFFLKSKVSLLGQRVAFEI